MNCDITFKIVNHTQMTNLRVFNIIYKISKNNFQDINIENGIKNIYVYLRNFKIIETLDKVKFKKIQKINK